MESALVLTEKQLSALDKIGVVLCYLHGSVARGDARIDSDVDIAALFERSPDDTAVATADVVRALSGFVREREMDVAILNDARPLLAQNVAVHGRILFARSNTDRMMFDIRTMHEYESSRRIARIGQDAALARI